MTLKDWVYLVLIGLTALIFYCNGFYSGVYRTKRMYDSLLEEQEEKEPPEKPPPHRARIAAKTFPKHPFSEN